MLIETDVLLASLNPHDPLRSVARKVLAEEHLLLSPYTLLELNLLIRAGKIKVKSFDNFAERLSTFFKSRGITVLPDNPRNHSIAQQIESDFGLTFFDSLHAAVAKSEGLALISFDSSYKRLRSIGVKHIDPRTVR